MLRFLFFTSIQFMFFLSFGQKLSYFDYDTLNHKYLTFGDLDSVDLHARRFSTSFLFSEGNEEILTLNPTHLFFPGNSVYNSLTPRISKMRYTSLPHIGFAYMFGAQGIQKINFDFEQALQHGFLINCSVDNFRTNGFYRNSNTLSNNYNLFISKKSKKFSIQTHFNASKSQRNWSDGLISDTLIDLFSPDLIPVRKENAQSKVNSFFAELTTKYSFINDSSKTIGFLTGHSFSLLKRFYSEEDSLSSLYAFTFFDSTKTFDSLLQHNFRNSFGFFYDAKNIVAEVGLQSDYWKYRSFSYVNDTLEVGLYTDFKINARKLQIFQRGNFNLVGAARGIENISSIQYLNRLFVLKLQYHLSHQLPTIFQRYFYSNNVIYKTLNLEKQFYHDLDFQLIKSVGYHKFKLSYVFGQFNNVYQFDAENQQWRNDLQTSLVVFQSFGLNSKLNFGILHGDLSYKYTLLNEHIRFMPTHSFNSRVFIKGGVFRAKKLKALLGVDFMAVSSYKRLTFIPQMTIFDLENSLSNLNNPGFMNVAIFTSFEVETFRLFFRMDNLASFWQDKKINLVEGYYFPSPQLKVGLTWDFWN